MDGIGFGLYRTHAEIDNFIIVMDRALELYLSENNKLKFVIFEKV